MPTDFAQIEWDEATKYDCRQIIRLWVHEDLGGQQDWTTLALVDQATTGQAIVVTRQSGVICGLSAVATALEEMNIRAQWSPLRHDGDTVVSQTVVGHLTGKARDLLTTERLLLNLIGHLSAVATTTKQYVDAIAATATSIYDTRKTTPGWRRLEKYAVRCGGGNNHRSGLFDAILIKDNHLAIAAKADGNIEKSVFFTVRHVQDFLRKTKAIPTVDNMLMEVEVDSLEQLKDALPACPNIVLLDNMSNDELRRAVAMRDELAPHIQLEASGGITLDNVAQVAKTGVERISIGALTHSARSFDVGLDWK